MLIDSNLIRVNKIKHDPKTRSFGHSKSKCYHIQVSNRQYYKKLQYIIQDGVIFIYSLYIFLHWM